MLNHQDSLCPLCSPLALYQRQLQQTQQTEMGDFFASIMGGSQNCPRPIVGTATPSKGSVMVTQSKVFFIGRDGTYELRAHAREIPYNVHLERSEVTTNG